ncbi:aldo/keto reductase [Ponticaulis sp.]|uniref:aldo/keto reductase n=1 Tax=Ponticaulis sp. TaxID=2020902 RepID=UPI000B712BF1|nr:aldo/keto reductase [Ponticaulis sp.]MAJ09986.1 aldo/keto reductase [Ponticaulis sp.]
MKKRAVGPFSVNPVGLGCMNIMHAYNKPISEEATDTLLNRALDLGYDFLDTATLYGFGESERRIGRFLKHRRDEFVLASKCVLGFKDGQRTLDARPESIIAACEASLERLQTDVIDLYYMHRPDPRVPIEDSVGALKTLVEQGKIKTIGLSEMSAEQLRQASAVHPIAAMQSEYSLIARNPEIAVIEACKELGTTLVSFSPVGRGIFSQVPLIPAEYWEGDMRRGNFFPRLAEPHFSENMKLVASAREIADGVGCSLPQLAIAWVLAKGEEIVTIPGTKDIDHLEDNWGTMEVTLNAATVEQLDEIFAPENIAGPRYSEMGQKSVTTEMYEFEQV